LGAVLPGPSLKPPLMGAILLHASKLHNRCFAEWKKKSYISGRIFRNSNGRNAGTFGERF